MKHFFFLLSCIFIFKGVFPQSSEKKALDHSVYDNWKKLSTYQISKDGQWVSYEINPQDGDGKLWLKSSDGTYGKQFEQGDGGIFSPHSDFLVFRIKPPKDTIRQLKLAGKKKKDFPKDSLGIYIFEKEKLHTVANIKSFKVPDKKGGWIAWLSGKDGEEDEEEEEEKEESSTDPDTATTKEENKKKEKGNLLTVMNPMTQTYFEFENVIQYEVSENGKLFGFVRSFGDTLDSISIHAFIPETETKILVMRDSGKVKGLTLDKQGQQMSYLFSKDSLEKHIYDLFYWNKDKGKVSLVADSGHSALPGGWSVSEYGNAHFSDDGSKLYFGTAPLPEQPVEDTLLDEEKAKVDVWNWKDDYLQPQQLKELKEEKKRNYLAVFHIKKEKVVQLADTKVRQIKLVDKGNARYALGISEKHYGKYISWEVPGYKDLYIVDLKTGEKTLVKKKQQYSSRLSPGGNYLLMYSEKDSNWYSYNVKTQKTVRVSEGIDAPLYEEEEDIPAEAWAYGIMGWMEDDEYVMIYDRYDIWKVDPRGKEKPVNFTRGYGRKNTIRFSYQNLDPEKVYINEEDIIYLKGFNETTKESGYFTLSMDQPSAPKKHIMDDYSFIGLKKAENAGRLIWRKMDYNTYPDLWSCGPEFKNPVKLSETNPQIDNYKWGTVSLTHWTSLDGSELEGLLYLPENFDSTRKYPMITYFYEKYSDRIHRHYSPSPSPSVINFPLYVSNDYIVFIPDIKYREGHPGRSAYDAILSGTQHVVDMGFVDKNHIGIQGQSWGGYQAAYLVTQTNYFAAAMAGAPVSNMTSAYGGIRWGSGMSRMMQYEEGQSRIGGTLWEKPLLYIENSPIFHVENVNTPLLIMHNDGDGAVPWYQGIEMFVALRRLQKPSWLLNYNDDEHNLMRRANRKDLSVRMMQFFDHYLKDKAQPVWMGKGIPATKKGNQKGFKLIRKNEKSGEQRERKVSGLK